MFNLGAGEIALISVVALLLLGPDKLPELARGLGKFLREFRKHTDDVRSMVEREFYRMDQDVLSEGPKQPAGSHPEVKVARFPPGLKQDEESSPRILPPPSFPPFPAPEGVVASPPPTEPAKEASGPASPAAPSPGQSNAVPGRDA